MGLYFWVKDWLSRRAVNMGTRFLLSPLAVAAWFYAQLQALRRWGFRRGLLRSYRPAVPVISVGNVTAGGTGKTPCVQTVCRLLQARGVRPAVLSRGYGGSLRGAVGVVSDGTSVLLSPQQAGDEPVFLGHSLPGVPVLVGRKRRDTARLAVESYGAGALVLDDGFQHLRLARDLDLVTVDARLPFGNGFCFPRGLLRESPRALSDADLVLLTRTRRVEERHVAASREAVGRHLPGGPVLRAQHTPVGLVSLPAGQDQPLERLAGLKVLAFAGIGQPEFFFQELRELGAEVLQSVPFPDHHEFQAADLERIVNWAGLMNAEAVITTEKDAVRLAEFLPLAVPLLALRIEMQVDDPALLEDALQKVLESFDPAPIQREE